MAEGSPGERFALMERAAVDACSVIYLLKTGVFERLAAVLHLVTTAGVYGETGWGWHSATEERPRKPRLPVSVLPDSPQALSNDHGLFLLAQEEGIPVISDDLDVLTLAREAGMDYYNSLMMLIYLSFKGRLDRDEYPVYRERLLQEARYGSSVIERADGYYASLFPPVD